MYYQIKIQNDERSYGTFHTKEFAEKCRKTTMGNWTGKVVEISEECGAKPALTLEHEINLLKHS